MTIPSLEPPVATFKAMRTLGFQPSSVLRFFLVIFCSCSHINRHPQLIQCALEFSWPLATSSPSSSFPPSQWATPEWHSCIPLYMSTLVLELLLCTLPSHGHLSCHTWDESGICGFPIPSSCLASLIKFGLNGVALGRALLFFYLLWASSAWNFSNNFNNASSSCLAWVLVITFGIINNIASLCHSAQCTQPSTSVMTPPNFAMMFGLKACHHLHHH